MKRVILFTLILFTLTACQTVDYKTLNKQANELVELENYEEAIKVYTKAINLEEHEALYINRGNAYFHAEEFEKAKNDFNKAKILNPQMEEVYINLGQLYTKLEDFEKAYETFDKLVELNQDKATELKENTLKIQQSKMQNNTQPLLTGGQ